MEEDKEKKLLKFYREMVTLSQKNLRSGSFFLEQAATSMIFGYEFGSERLHSRTAYEKLLLWNLIYNDIGNQEINKTNLLTILGPFSLVNQNNYYTNLLLKEPLLNRELIMISKLAFDLEKNNKESFPIYLLNQKDKSLITNYQAFSKLKLILRNGWVKRKVKEEYIENDSIHTMQMIALASAYFNTYNISDLDCDKVLEMMIIHEIGEILAGDITEIDKNHDSKYDLEHQAVINTFTPLKKGNYLISLWEEFEERQTEEAQFVYACDKLDPILKAEYLDSVLNRDDLFIDFFTFEENRGTFKKGKWKELFNSIGKEYLKRK